MPKKRKINEQLDAAPMGIDKLATMVNSLTKTVETQSAEISDLKSTVKTLRADNLRLRHRLTEIEVRLAALGPQGTNLTSMALTMTSQTPLMNRRLNRGLPGEYGSYIFLLTNGELREGLYNSFPTPYGTAVKICYDYWYGYTEYHQCSEIVGYLSCTENYNVPTH